MGDVKDILLPRVVALWARATILLCLTKEVNKFRDKIILDTDFRRLSGAIGNAPAPNNGRPGHGTNSGLCHCGPQ
jgi:hypothetical protein